MKTTFEGEIEHICRRIAMCEKWKNRCCSISQSPEQCPRALKAVKKLNNRLILGNSGGKAMIPEDIHACHDMIFYL